MAFNSSRQEYIEAVKSSFVSLAKKQIISVLTKQFAFLAWGPLAPLFSIFIEKILTIAVNNTETGIFFLYVDFRVNQQSREFSRAALENYRIQISGTQEEKNEAEKKLIKIFDDFVKFNRI